jgi:hypothetical protein
VTSPALTPRRLAALGAVLGVLAVVPATAAGAPAWLAPFDVTTVQNACVNSPSPCNSSDARPIVAMSPRGDVAFGFTDPATHALMLRVRPPGGVLGPAQALAVPASGESAFLQRLAFDAAGNLSTLYTRDKFSAPMAFSANVRVRQANGTFLDEEPLASGTTTGFRTSLDVNERGEAVATWQANGPVEAAFRSAGEKFGTPVTLAASGGGASGPQAAIGAGGDASVVWTEPTNHDLDASYRPAGGAFTSPGHKISTLQAPFGASSAVAPDGSVVFAWVATNGPQTLVQRAFRAPGAGGAFTADSLIGGFYTGGFTFAAGVATDSSGNSVAAWEHNGEVDAATRSAGAEFAGPTVLGSGGSTALGADPDGGAAVTWLGLGSATVPPSLQAAVRPRGGTFGNATTVKTTDIGRNLVNAGAGMDREGNGVAGFSDFSAKRAGPEPVGGAGFDAVPPRLSGLQVPAAGGQHSPLAFSVGVFDEWGPVTTSWRFGDGGTATGAEVRHAYDRPGRYDVSVTARDAAGNSAGPLAGRATVADTEAPAFTATTLSNTTFRDATGATAVAARKRARRGTTIRFSLSEAAKVTIGVQRKTRGRKFGRRCVKQTHRNRSRKACTRFVRALTTLRRAGRPGANRVPFTGRVRGKRLRPGVHRFVLRAADAAGHRSRAKLLRFRIVR